MRYHHLGTMFTLFAFMLAWPTAAAVGTKSDSKVKATATATKIAPDGKQTVTINLEIEKDWYIYANPVGAEDFEPNKTRVSVKAKEKVMASVKYPTGKLKINKVDKVEVKFHVYEGKVTIETLVTRTMGDSSPLEISIDVNSCSKDTCLLPGTVKLRVP